MNTPTPSTAVHTQPQKARPRRRLFVWLKRGLVSLLAILIGLPVTGAIPAFAANGVRACRAFAAI